MCLQVSWGLLLNADSDLRGLAGAPDSAFLTSSWVMLMVLPVEGRAQGKAPTCLTRPLLPPSTA